MHTSSSLDNITVGFALVSLILGLIAWMFAFNCLVSSNMSEKQFTTSLFTSMGCCILSLLAQIVELDYWVLDRLRLLVNLSTVVRNAAIILALVTIALNLVALIVHNKEK